jgi:hypothetical protein
VDDPILGKTISKKYDVLSLLGKGGMGTVSKVQYTALSGVPGATRKKCTVSALALSFG